MRYYESCPRCDKQPHNINGGLICVCGMFVPPMLHGASVEEAWNIGAKKRKKFIKFKKDKEKVK